MHQHEARGREGVYTNYVVDEGNKGPASPGDFYTRYNIGMRIENSKKEACFVRQCKIIGVISPPTRKFRRGNVSEVVCINILPFVYMGRGGR